MNATSTKPNHSRKWVVSLKDTVEPDQLFKYTDTETCTVVLRRVGSRIDPGRDLTLVEPLEANLGRPYEHEVHAGYRSCLAGFLREIDIMIKGEDSSHNILFRGTYLTKVLDRFGDELFKPRAKNVTGPMFRSKVLNPILQRQMRGVTDYEASAVQLAVGTTTQEVADFYLRHDPLAQSNRIARLHNSIYIWPVRLSFMFLKSGRITNSIIDHTMGNTHLLYGDLQPGWIAGKLTKTERRVIELESTETIYAELIAVSAPSSSHSW
jgi:hypothetical protein